MKSYARADRLSSLQGLQNENVVVERDDYSQREGLKQGEHREKDEVPWVRMTFPEEKAESNQCTKQGDVERP